MIAPRAISLVATLGPALVVAELNFLNLTDRGCGKNDTFHLGSVSYQVLNATGSLEVEGFRAPGFEKKIWTWSTGVQKMPNSDSVYKPVVSKLVLCESPILWSKAVIPNTKFSFGSGSIPTVQILSKTTFHMTYATLRC